MNGNDRLPVFQARITAHAIKALRESKVNTSWLSPMRRTRQRQRDSWTLFSIGGGTLDAFPTSQARVAKLGICHSPAQLRFRDAFARAIVVSEETDNGLAIPAATPCERFPLALLVPDSTPDGAPS